MMRFCDEDDGGAGDDDVDVDDNDDAATNEFPSLVKATLNQRPVILKRRRARSSRKTDQSSHHAHVRARYTLDRPRCGIILTRATSNGDFSPIK